MKPMRTSSRTIALLAVALLLPFAPPNRVHVRAHELAAELATGDLDSTFGNGGKVTTDFSGEPDAASGMALQPDGRIVVVGQDGSNSSGIVALARYNSNGGLDTSFGTGGKVTISVGAASSAAAVALQSDGRIIVGGSYFTAPGPSGNQNFLLLRYNFDGSLDTSFGFHGVVTTDFFGTADFVSDLAIRPDGRIVVAGTATNAANTALFFAIAQYDSNGSLDPSFGSGGKVTTDFVSIGGSIPNTSAMLLQTDGRVVVVGATLTSGNLDFALSRYNGDGNLDATFGTGGKVITDFVGLSDIATDIAIQADGRYVVVGQTKSTNDVNAGDFALARYNIDGSLDTAFGNGGRVVTDFNGGSDFANAIAITSTGRIVAAGLSTGHDAPFSDFALARYNTDGNLDSSFGAGGKTITDFFGNDDSVQDIAVRSDGRYVVVGIASTTPVFQGRDFALAQYVGDPAFDICVQDDSRRTVVQFNSITGAYQFTDCAKHIIATGSSTVSVKACKTQFNGSGSTSSVSALVNTCTKRGDATVTVQGSPPIKYTIGDSNITNNTCACQ